MRRRPIVRILDAADPETLAQADVDWWLEATAEERILAVEEAKRDYERMGGRLTPRSRGGLNSDFEDFFRLLNEHGVEYLIVGGYAVSFHSTPRYTKDIDILLRPSIDNARRAIAAMTEFIGAPDLTPERLARPGKVLMFGVPPTRIDVLSSIDGCSFAKAWPRRVESRYGRQKVWFLGLNDLIRAKKAAGRDQDRIDVERLLRAKRRRRED